VSDFRQRKAQERLHEGQAALAREDFGAAEEAFDHALRLDPSAKIGWLLWAESLERQGKLIEASRVLRDALDHHPGDPALELAVAQAQAEIGQFGPAEAGLLELHRQWPSEREPLAHLARVYRDTRKWTRLVELLEHALAGEFANDAEFAGLLDRCRTWRGERRDPPVVVTSMRELMLSEHGVVLLGTSHDDAAFIPWYSTYLCSERDAIVTCARLLGHAEQFDWRWRSVIAIDPAARVLAELLARALDIPQVDSEPEREPDPEHTLAVASCLAPGWQADAPGWVRECAEQGNLFAFAVLHYHRHTAPLPALVGLAGGERICLAWHRLGEARIGFSRFGLIAGLPDEIDEREPAIIADALLDQLRELQPNLGPGFASQLRHVHEQRAHVHPGLRRRSDFARILPHPRPEPAQVRDLLEALEHAGVAELERALAPHERAPERIGPAEIDALADRFRVTPTLRSRLADLLYRVAPDRLTDLLEDHVARPDEVVLGERDALLHLYGCNPWNREAPAVLGRWLDVGSASNRCEIVQSKYGLHLLAEGSPDGFGERLDGLLADSPAIVIATLRWLHDNPHLQRDHVDRVAPLVEHAHPDVVFEALQLLRIAGRPIATSTLARLLDPNQHPRLRSAAVELLELLPIADTHPRLDALLREDEGSQVWAAARSLLRGGTTIDERVAGAQIIAARLAELAEDGKTTGPIRRMLRALTSAEQLEALLAIFAWPSPALIKIAATALTSTLLSFDDPRLLELLRRDVDAFGLDPPPGLARFLLEHGDPGLDRPLVLAAEGAVDPWAGYEAKAVLARWGDHEAAAELHRALDHASPFAEAALEAAMTIVEADEFDRLDRARDAGGKLAVSAWQIVCDRALEGSLEARARLAEHMGKDPRWLGFLEARLRDQVPGKFVVGAQTAEFGVLAALLPEAFDRLVDRTLSGTPDRFAVDLLEWLGRERPELGRVWATRHRDSGHFGLRQCARRILA
jgi:hypothetical protein